MRVTGRCVRSSRMRLETGDEPGCDRAASLKSWPTSNRSADATDSGTASASAGRQAIDCGCMKGAVLLVIAEAQELARGETGGALARTAACRMRGERKCWKAERGEGRKLPASAAPAAWQAPQPAPGPMRLSAPAHCRRSKGAARPTQRPRPAARAARLQE